MSEGDKLTAAAIRAFLAAPKNPYWEGQARQLLAWAADLIEAAEEMAATGKSSGEP